jgi:hypothetical protein
MKYIITEDRMNDLVSQFLDQYDWYAWDSTGDGDLAVYDTLDDKKLFYTGYYGDSADTGESEYSLKINRDFFDNTLNQFFGKVLDPWSIVKWFNDKFQINCVSFDFFDSEDEEF